MMRIAYLYLLLAIACTSPAAESTEDTSAAIAAPDITITVPGIPQGWSYLIGFFEDQQFKLDSASVDGQGKMRFQQEEAYPQGFYYVLFPNQQAIQILVDQDQQFSLNTESGNFVGAMQVKGSQENEILYQNLKFQEAFQPRIEAASNALKQTTEGTSAYTARKSEQDKLVQERKDHLQEIFDKYPNAFFTKFKIAGQNPDVVDVRLPDGTVDQQKQVYLYRKAFWEGVDFSDERLLRTPVIINKLKRYITELTPQNQDSVKKYASVLIDQVLDKPDFYKFFVNWIAVNFEPGKGKTKIMDAEAIYVHLVQNYITEEKAFWADAKQVEALQKRANEMAGSLMGLQAHDVEAPDLNGNKRKIYDMKQPYLIVYLYNPTCDHCIEESPKLVSWYRQKPSNQVGVYAIVIGSEGKEWKDFVANNRMEPFTNVSDPTYASIYARYYVDNTPEIYLLNPERKIIGKNLKTHQIDEMIQKDKTSIFGR